MIRETIEQIMKKAVAVMANKEGKFMGMKITSYGGVPKDEVWIFGKGKIYKWIEGGKKKK